MWTMSVVATGGKGFVWARSVVAIGWQGVYMDWVSSGYRAARSLCGLGQ